MIDGSTFDVALATCRDLPRLDPDEALLVDAFARAGVRAAPVVWDDATFDWSRVRACLIRSTWDYTNRRDAFVEWAEQVESRTRLFNSARVVRWNTHKRYLHDLERRGVAVVPTAWAERGGRTDVRALLEARGWRDIVVKPAVGAGARNAIRTDDASVAQSHVDAIAAHGDAMIQPYLASVEARGERSLVFLGGTFSHAVRKHAALSSGPRHGGEPAVVADSDEIAFAERALEAAIEPVLYARVDIARASDGSIALMELELTEPSLFFAQSPGADDRLARELLARL
jgi:glutathione synthase/RimK-type ligase-like ATP-grasp enzyme